MDISLEEFRMRGHKSAQKKKIHYVSSNKSENVLNKNQLLRCQINSKERCPWEASTSSAIHEITYMLRRLSVVTLFTRSRHMPLSWATCIQWTPSYPISRISIQILFIHPLLNLSSGIFPSGFQTKILHAFLFSSICAIPPFIISSLLW